MAEVSEAPCAPPGLRAAGTGCAIHQPHSTLQPKGMCVDGIHGEISKAYRIHSTSTQYLLRRVTHALEANR
eukprot:4691278-Amphidinium_carterae.2